MWVLTLTSLLLCIAIQAAERAISNKRLTEGSDTVLHCKKTKGKVTWSKSADGGREEILTAPHDPHQRFILFPNSSLLIKNLSVSDSGIYSCKRVPVVKLTVTPAKEKHSKKRKQNKGADGKSTPPKQPHWKVEQKQSPSVFLVMAAVLAGAGLVVLLWKSNFQTQSPKSCLAEHFYETIDDTAGAAAPGSEKPITVYVLANDPATRNLGTNKPQPCSTAETLARKNLDVNVG